MAKTLATVLQSWEAFYLRYEAALKKVGRKKEDVQILPVSKTRAASELRPWLGLPEFPKCLGENYASELEEKAAELKDDFPALEWHFLGPLQSRKIADLCRLVSCLQTVSRSKELKILKKLLDEGRPLPKFLFQVNVSSEEQKNGCSPEELPLLIEELGQLGLSEKLKGLMCLPSSLSKVGEKELRKEFAKLRLLKEKHWPSGILSMGMSEDFEIAISEGSDLVRVGTILFGERK